MLNCYQCGQPIAAGRVYRREMVVARHQRADPLASGGFVTKATVNMCESCVVTMDRRKLAIERAVGVVVLAVIAVFVVAVTIGGLIFFAKGGTLPFLQR